MDDKELIERLRWQGIRLKEEGYHQRGDRDIRAADRIEALTKQLEEARGPLNLCPRTLEVAAKVAMGDWDSLKRHVHAAAVAWCGTKECETFPEDIAYFEQNWTYHVGLFKFVAAHAIRNLKENPDAAE